MWISPYQSLLHGISLREQEKKSRKEQAQVTISEEFYLKRNGEMEQEMNVGYTEGHAKVGSITACSRAGRYGLPGRRH